MPKECSHSKYFDTIIQLVNVYAPSGSGKKSFREELFQNYLLYILRGNVKNLVLGGDWNSVTTKRDCSNMETDLLSPAFSALKNS